MSLQAGIARFSRKGSIMNKEDIKVGMEVWFCTMGGVGKGTVSGPPEDYGFGEYFALGAGYQELGSIYSTEEEALAVYEAYCLERAGHYFDLVKATAARLLEIKRAAC